MYNINIDLINLDINLVGRGYNRPNRTTARRANRQPCARQSRCAELAGAFSFGT